MRRYHLRTGSVITVEPLDDGCRLTVGRGTPLLLHASAAEVVQTFISDVDMVQQAEPCSRCEGVGQRADGAFGQRTVLCGPCLGRGIRWREVAL